MADYLFVYGSLRNRIGRGHGLLGADATPVALGQVQAELYEIASYPGAVPCSDPEARVVGEVYRLAQPHRVLARLDRYEEFDPHDVEASQFRRERTRVHLIDGRSVAAWVYWYNRDPRGLPRIETGDFRIPLGHRRRFAR
jgi:pyruvate carboxylase